MEYIMKSNEMRDIKSLLEMIDAKIEHIEDINADNRAVIVKLVKQSNQIVKFLSQIDITMEDVTNEYKIGQLPDTNNTEEKTAKWTSIKELVEEYMDRAKDLQELEDELRKHKDKLTPGQVGES